eukprot:Nk52_evm25s2578 gene=Nk52_evmTU25s2578
MNDFEKRALERAKKREALKKSTSVKGSGVSNDLTGTANGKHFGDSGASSAVDSPISVKSDHLERQKKYEDAAQRRKKVQDELAAMEAERVQRLKDREARAALLRERLKEEEKSVLEKRAQKLEEKQKAAAARREQKEQERKDALSNRNSPHGSKKTSPNASPFLSVKKDHSRVRSPKSIRRSDSNESLGSVCSTTSRASSRGGSRPRSPATSKFGSTDSLNKSGSSVHYAFGSREVTKTGPSAPHNIGKYPRVYTAADIRRYKKYLNSLDPKEAEKVESEEGELWKDIEKDLLPVAKDDGPEVDKLWDELVKLKL